MENPIKLIQNRVQGECTKLGTISNLVMMSRTNRSSTAMLLLLDSIIKLSEQKPKLTSGKEPIRILVVGSGESLESSMKRMGIVQKVLDRLNIDVVFLGKDFDKNKNLVHTFSSEFGLDFGYGESVTVEQKIGEQVRKEIELQLLNTYTENQTDFIEERLKHFDKKIPIQGKSSKKGKSNHFGSKFHR